MLDPVTYPLLSISPRNHPSFAIDKLAFVSTTVVVAIVPSAIENPRVAIVIYFPSLFRGIPIVLILKPGNRFHPLAGLNDALVAFGMSYFTRTIFRFDHINGMRSPFGPIFLASGPIGEGVNPPRIEAIFIDL
jgi:hypothetical protein